MSTDWTATQDDDCDGTIRRTVPLLIVCLGLVGALHVVRSPHQHRSARSVDLVVAVLTQPDAGPKAWTLCWSKPAVRIHFDLQSYPAWYVAAVRAALAWATGATGVATVEVGRGVADLTITTGPGTGAFTSADGSAGGSIGPVVVRLGCCRVRPMWEDVLHPQ